MTSKHRKRFTEVQKEEIVKKYLAGQSAYSLADEYGFNGSSVVDMLKRSGIVTRPKLITSEEIEIAKDKYINDGWSLETIAAYLNRDPHAIQKKLHISNVKMRNPTEMSRKYIIDENYFDVIDTQEKAYWLGLLYADGYNNETTGVIAITLIEEDEELLLKFKNTISPDKPFGRPLKRKESHTQQTSFSITSQHMSKRLSELGCHKNKSLTVKFPTEDQVPSHLLRHFIRGMWDGDGSFYLTKRGSFGCNLTGTENICYGCKLFIEKELGIEIPVYQRKNNHIRYITISNQMKVYKFILWLYNNASIYMSRKYNKCKIIENVLINKNKISEVVLC